MSQPKAEFIKIAVPEGYKQTTPVEPENRLPDSDIQIEFCDESDADKISEGLYTCFPPSFWDRKEPPALRPSDSERHRLLAKRLLPMLTAPHLRWIKAVHIPSRQTMGVACWTLPGAPIFNHFLRSAVDEFGWRARMQWSDTELDEMWAGTSDAAWNGQSKIDDELRRGVLGDEAHWFLAPLITWPEFQGRGVGKRLMAWAMEQADATEPPVAMYLESAPTARAVYMHCGFVPVGKYNFVRRGDRVVRPEDYEDVVNVGDGGGEGR